MIIYDIYFILLLACVFMCIYRMGTGPELPDRSAAIYTLGTVVVGISALFSLMQDTDFYLNVSISWALLSYIGTLAQAKYLQGKRLSE